MNADFVDSGFDLFLSDIGDHYLVLVGTSRGDDIVLMSGCLLRVSRTGRGFRRVQAPLETSGGPRTGRGSSSAIFPRSWRWSTTARCGMRWANAACPAARAAWSARPAIASTSMTRSSSAAEGGPAIRSWDSCLFKTHALVAGGENFRAIRGVAHQVPLLPQAARFRRRVRPAELHRLRPVHRGLPGQDRHRYGHRNDSR